MWYSGTASVTTGSVEVIGDANVDFIANIFAGDAFISDGNGLSIEVQRVESKNKLILARRYTGPGGSFPFAIQPTQDFSRTLAAQIIDFRNTYGAFRDTILQGSFPSGTTATPGVRFIADQDSGMYLPSANVVGLVAGGVIAATFFSTRMDVPGHIKLEDRKSIGLLPDSQSFNFAGGPAALYGMTVGVNIGAGGPATVLAGFGGLIFGTGAIEQGRIDQYGNFFLGVTSAPEHTIAKGAGQGSAVLRVRSNAAGALDSLVVASVSAYSPNGAGAAVYLGHSTATNRSMNASGTVNASGADYAEYMVKAAGCGTIAKGDVCGVDRDGKLTDRWSDAISFMVKSTDPSLVGGDTWAAHVPARPVEPSMEPPPPVLPAVPAEGATDPEIVSYRDSLAAYPAQVAQYRADHATWVEATAAYQRDLPAWEAKFEAARVLVDRIAYCGQVPVNMTGSVEVGDYLVAVQDGDGIAVVAVADAAITFDQYRRRVGKVLAIRDGRPWIDVQHG